CLIKILLISLVSFLFLSGNEIIPPLLRWQRSGFFFSFFTKKKGLKRFYGFGRHCRQPRRVHTYMNIKYSVYTLHGSLPKLDDIIELVNLNGGKHKMSKVVAHMGKLKAENLGGIQRHNERLNNSYSNDMIDVSRSYLNYDLVKKSELSYKETVDKHIAENIVLKRALRKDAVLVNEWIISSDREFFDKLNDRQIREYFQTVVDYFNEKCG